MKKLVLNISDSLYEKFRFESILESKSLHEIISKRMVDKPFDEQVEKAFDCFMEMEIEKIFKE